MLEDNSGVPSIEEQKKYRSIIKEENSAHQITKETSKSEALKRIEFEIRSSKE